MAHERPTEHGAPLEDLRRSFEAMGFTDAVAAARRWIALSGAFPHDHPYARWWRETLEMLRGCADPDLAFSMWLRWVEEDASPPAGTSPRAEAWEMARFRHGFLAIAGASPALGEALLATWEDFRPDEWESAWETRASLSRRLSAAVEQVRDKEFPDALRRFKRLEMLRIAHLDFVQSLAVDQVALQISSLADALIQACLDRAFSQVSARRGITNPGRGFVVLALGKLGGMELNYSSDVDLNFVFDETLESLATQEGGRIDDPHVMEAYFTGVAERLTDLIGAFSELGQLYRFDGRLRPEGSAGRLVWSARASIDYYYSRGRAWERQALLRLRPIAGDFVLAARLCKELEGFVFPESFSAKEVAEIRALKLQIEKLAGERGQSEPEIKIGKGGIRDVEYIVQYLQLIHAARIPALRTGSTFRVLEVLELEGFLKPEEADILRRGYRFLRRVEHHIQIMHLRQTHQLPADPREMLRLARGLGFDSALDLLGRLEEHSTRVRRVHTLLFGEATAPRSATEELPVLFDLPLEVSAKLGARTLEAFGFLNPQAAFLRLRSLACGSEDGMILDAKRSKEVFAQLVLKLLREVSRQPEPDRTLQAFEECVRSLGARSVFYQLLVESDRILQLFIEICARGTLVVETLRAYPALFDEVVDALLTGYEFTGKSLAAEAGRIYGEGRAFEREIFTFKHLHLLLIAIRDLEHLDNLSTTMLRIADLAEALLHVILRRTLEEAEAKLGAWVSAKPRFLVLGLGKFGGQEMNYRSDVDIVFLYEGKGTTQRDTGVQEYFERLSQMVLEQSGLSDGFGPLLHVDVRLRPLGNHNSLAIAMDAWKQHFLGGQALTWERQAFLRARPVAGDEALAREAASFIRDELPLGGSAGPRSRAGVLADVLDMRRRLEIHARPGDLKRGAGGIMDVEFLVQALQLCHGKAHPEVLSPNTADGLKRLMAAGILPAPDGSELLTAYQFLRWLENRLALVGSTSSSFSAMSAGELQSLVQKIGYKSSGEESAVSIFESELAYHRRQNRAMLEKILGAMEGGAAER